MLIVGSSVTVDVDTGEGTIALAISLLSLGVAAVALGWQIVSFWLAKGRVRARLMWAGRTGTILATMPPERTYPAEMFATQGMRTPALAAVVRNVGRAPAFIDNYAIRLANGSEIGWVKGTVGVEPVPIRIEPDASATVFVDLDMAERMIAAAYGIGKTNSTSMEAWIVVYLGSEKKISTKEKVTITIPDEMAEEARKIADDHAAQSKA